MIPIPKRLVALIWSSLILLAAPGRGAVVTASYTSATTVPVTAAGYTATGNTVDLSLGFAPSTGTNLTVVNNTGLGFIVGTFTNLAQGQAVNLSYNGLTYPFVANYYGGSGNDLVLQWAKLELDAWGDNTYGQLGNNSTTTSIVPVAVIRSGILAGKTVTTIAAGANYNLVMCSDGTLAAWGYDHGFGMLGNGNSADSSVPLAVMQSGVLAGKTVVSAATGDSHTLALCSDGTLAAWGNNSDGQFGNGTLTGGWVPGVAQTGFPATGRMIAGMASGSAYTLALVAQPLYSPVSTLSALVLSSGTLTPAFASTTSFYAASVPTGTASITIGPTVTDPTATVKVNGVVVASGSASGPIALAMGSNTITVVATAEDITRQSTYTIVVTRGVLNATFNSANSIAVTSSSYSAAGNDVTFTLGFAPPTGTNLTVVNNTGTGFIVGKFNNLAQGQAVNLSYNGLTYPFVANYYGGSGNDLVLQWAKQDLAAWGSNSSGQLGNNSTTYSSVPVAVIQSGVLAGKTILTMAVGSSHTLALCADGTLAAWGNNADGQLGNGSTTSSSVPVAVTPSGVLAGKTVIAVSRVVLTVSCCVRTARLLPGVTISTVNSATLAARTAACRSPSPKARCLPASRWLPSPRVAPTASRRVQTARWPPGEPIPRVNSATAARPPAACR